MAASAWSEWAFRLAVWGFLGWCLLGGPILIATVGIWRLVHWRPGRKVAEPYVWIGGWHLVQADDYGTLWQRRWPIAHHRIVEVVDATPQPDGSSRRYRIRVPPEMSTAREAVAWTFDFDDPAEYAPSAET